MSNMSYCRFQNTLADLRDCEEKLMDLQGDLSSLSKEEQRAAKALIAVCYAIWHDFGDEK